MGKDTTTEGGSLFFKFQHTWEIYLKNEIFVIAADS